jgi:hypothetical protein
MASVTINGHTYSDDASPTTGLGGGGHRARFIPLISDVVTVLGTVAANGNLTINRVLVSNGSGQVAASSVTSTELGYLSGVTSAIQTQLNAKAPLASPALTGTATAAKLLVGTTTDDASGANLQVNGFATFKGGLRVGAAGSSQDGIYMHERATGFSEGLNFLDGDGATVVAVVGKDPLDQIIFRSGDNITTDNLTLKTDGTVSIFGQYQIRNTQVVSARKTGWAAATGTASRATFATNTVTTEQLAQRVKALLDDLISHGLIGS